MLVVVVSDAILMMIIMMVMVIIAWLEDVRCSVVKSSVDASQDFSTGFNHVGSEGELLTVEHKEISVFLKGLLAGLHCFYNLLILYCCFSISSSFSEMPWSLSEILSSFSAIL